MTTRWRIGSRSTPTAPASPTPVRAGGARCCGTATRELELCGGEAGDTTNNRMELTAPIKALEALKRRSRRAHLHRQHLRPQRHHEVVRRAGQRNGWQTSAKQPVKNVDLWQELVAAVRAARRRVALGQGPRRRRGQRARRPARRARARPRRSRRPRRERLLVAAGQAVVRLRRPRRQRRDRRPAHRARGRPRTSGCWCCPRRS